MAWRAGGLAPLRERNYLLFFVGQSSSLLGDGMVGVALSFAVLDLTGSPADLGYVLAARSIPMVGMLLFAGVIGDRQPRRRVMVTADLIRFLSQGTVAALLISGRAQIWQLMILEAVHGTASALFYPAATGLIPQIVTERYLQQANALRGLATSVGDIAGPALAGVLVAVAGPGWAIAVDAASFAVSAVFLALVRLPGHPQPSAAGRFGGDLREGWREFASRRWVWATVVCMSLSNMLFGALLVLGPVVARQSMGGAPAWAAILATFGAGSLVGGLATLRIRPARPLLTAALAATVFPLPALGLAAELPVVAVCGLALVAGCGLTLFNALWETTLQRGVPQAALSRVSAYDWFGSMACQPVGQIAAGPVAVGIGIGPALWLSGCVQACVGIILLSVPDLRRLRPAQVAAGPTGNQVVRG